MAKKKDQQPDIDLIQSEKVDIALIDNNEGQIPGVKKNPREMTVMEFKKLKNSLTKNPGYTAISELKLFPFNGRFVTIGGNMRLRAMQELGWDRVIGKILPADTPVEKLNEWILLDNANFGKWNFDALANEWDELLLDEMNIEIPNLYSATEAIETEAEAREYESLTKDFFLFPVSVLDSRNGEWMERKRQWKLLGLKSEEGREKELLFSPTSLSPGELSIVNAYAKAHNLNSSEAARILGERGELRTYHTTSIFDPVLCEACYRWFNIRHGKILDPFAGGSVRGIVASSLQMPYYGNDLRPEQIEANRENLKTMATGLVSDRYQPQWTIGDSSVIDEIMEQHHPEAKAGKFDMIFSCPPYADLEKYSDNPQDISNMEYDDFISVYRKIIDKSCQMLKDNRFAVFVVGDVRDKKGFYRNFVNDTIKAFEDAGLKYYGQLVLINNSGAAAIRARKAYETRKIVKTHQQVIVALKGEDPNTKLEKYEQTSVTAGIKHFNKTRQPIDAFDYVQVFYKSQSENPKQIAADFPPGGESVAPKLNLTDYSEIETD